MDYSKYTICVDMDDTIEYLVRELIKWLNFLYGYDVDPDLVDDWDIHKFYPGLEPEQIYSPLYIPQFWDYVKPDPIAQVVLKKLIDEGFKVYICTYTHYSTAKEKFERCLFKHFPYLDARQIICMRDKQMIKCDILVDDGAHNIVGDYIGLLMDRPHNYKFNTLSYPNVHRVFDWNQVYDQVHYYIDARESFN